MTSNCLASVSIGCLFCFQRCNAEKIQVAFTFLPPQSSYTVEGRKIVYIADALKGFAFYQQAADHSEVRFVRTARGERCPLVWIRPSGASSVSQRPVREQPIVLVHCHGNATDIGMMMGPYFEMSKQLGIEVVGVEYSGYGVSTGGPGPANTYADVEAAYDHLIAQGVAPERIIAYGQSVGSGPAAYIASKHKIGGLILHSPLMSGISVIDPQPDHCCRPSCVFGCCDFYPNDSRLKRATCPTFVMHGQLDDIVPFYHGYRLSEMTPEEYRWPGYFPAGAGHNNIVEASAVMYFQELAKFVRHVSQQASGSNSSAMGGIQQKPKQVEMANVLGAREVDRLWGAEPWHSEEEGSNTGMMSFPEPVVGPEDHMYSSLRREKPSTGAESRSGERKPTLE